MWELFCAKYILFIYIYFYYVEIINGPTNICKSAESRTEGNFLFAAENKQRCSKIGLVWNCLLLQNIYRFFKNQFYFFKSKFL